MVFFGGGKGKRAMVNDNTDSPQFPTHPTGGSLPSFPFPATHMVGETQSDTTMHGSARLGDICKLHIITKSKKRQKSKMKKKQKKKKKGAEEI